MKNFCSFKRFKRYIEWFRDTVVVKQEDGNPPQDKNPPKSDAKYFEAVEPENFYYKQDFQITLIKRNVDLVKKNQNAKSEIKQRGEPSKIIAKPS